ncbi:MAG: nucleotidyltransferase family protein [Deltaproteobacteria bacterium]|nr:nucleotidyltransferase family protein [Deltaproteobacteria bacterium]
MVPKARSQRFGLENSELLSEIIAKLRQNLPEIALRFQVKSLLLFGSYVRAKQRKGSDLDILVEFIEPPSFFEFLALERYLSNLLGVKVDLVMKEALKPTIGKHVLAEAVPV